MMRVRLRRDASALLAQPAGLSGTGRCLARDIEGGAIIRAGLERFATCESALLHRVEHRNGIFVK